MDEKPENHNNYIVCNGVTDEVIENDSTAVEEQNCVLPQTVTSSAFADGGTVNVEFVNNEVNERTVSLPKEQLIACIGGEEAGSLVKESSRKSVNQQWFTTKDDKCCLQSKGVKWRQGMWTKDEEAVLRDNIAGYCKERNITDPTSVIFLSAKEDRKTFYRTIARGISRPLFSIYRKVLRMFDTKNYIGKYTDEELEKLEMLKEKHGNDWATIGGALGRSASSVKDRCRLIKSNKRQGKWTAEEEQLLSNAIHEQTKTAVGESITTGISWASVATIVATRTEKQCRSKWLNYLNWKESDGQSWSKNDEIELIKRVSCANVTDESEINWSSIASDWPSARSPQWLRSKWWCMKRKIRANEDMAFQEVLCYLQTSYMDNLRVRLERQNAGTPNLDFDDSTSDSFQSQQANHSLSNVITAELLHDSAVMSKGGDDESLVSHATFTGVNRIDMQHTFGLQLQLTGGTHPVVLQSVPIQNDGTTDADQYIIHNISVSQLLSPNGITVPCSHLSTQSNSSNLSHSQTSIVSSPQDVQFSQAIVQTDLSIPLSCSEMTRDEFTTANIQAMTSSIGDEIQLHSNVEDEIS